LNDSGAAGSVVSDMTPLYAHFNDFSAILVSPKVNY
jgi:hypothetical protein